LAETANGKWKNGPKIHGLGNFRFKISDLRAVTSQWSVVNIGPN